MNVSTDLQHTGDQVSGDEDRGEGRVLIVSQVDDVQEHHVTGNHQWQQNASSASLKAWKTEEIMK